MTRQRLTHLTLAAVAGFLGLDFFGRAPGGARVAQAKWNDIPSEWISVPFSVSPGCEVGLSLFDGSDAGIPYRGTLRGIKSNMDATYVAAQDGASVQELVGRISQAAAVSVSPKVTASVEIVDLYGQVRAYVPFR